MAINWDEALDGQTHLLVSGSDFEAGTDYEVVLQARREAIRRRRPLKMKMYTRLSEVERQYRDAFGRKFPVIAVRAGSVVECEQGTGGG